MKLYKDYLELKEIFKTTSLDRKRDREDSLSWGDKSDFEKVLLWKERYFASTYEHLHSYFSLFLSIAGFVFGFSLASGMLLFYSGKEPVNILFFLSFVVIIPFFISLISFFYNLVKQTIKGAVLLKSTSLAGVFFSLGALVALLVIITTKDIAFGWATTLDISAKELYSILDSFAIWKFFCSTCMVSIDVVEKSHYVRAVHDFAMQKSDAIELGSWWKYLAMAILFYGVIFRAIIFVLTNILFKKILKKEILKISSDLILNFNTPYIEYEANSNEIGQDSIGDEFRALHSIKELRDERLSIAVYGFKEEELDSLELQVDSVYVVGKRSFNDDEKFLKSSDVLFVIRAYDAPILDIVDLIRDDMKVYLIGSRRDISIWLRKFAEQGISPKVYVGEEDG